MFSIRDFFKMSFPFSVSQFKACGSLNNGINSEGFVYDLFTLGRAAELTIFGDMASEGGEF